MNTAMYTHTFKHTERGFARYAFADCFGSQCSLQKSSLATDDAIWLGVDDAAPKIMAMDASSLGVRTNETCGWVPYPIPDAVSLTTRMLLTRSQVQALLPLLQHFAETGELPVPDKEDGR